ncbi:hypothetical protein RD1_4079 [Roseobacter denitrificans OCh 114]|uniref:Uncharacterized protein n=1 Tax=Roseobacter denitrificans (strain ATCC 33942 / OCh 114) TaxID=375451 RepID=Q160S0_ROSDO|nr:hypothetical protein RD1_4079 [Roseobacter denitrificans OCh 114]
MRKAAEFFPLTGRKTTLRADQDRPGPRVLRQRQALACTFFVTKHDASRGIPTIQHPVQPNKIINRRHKSTATLLGSFNRMGLQSVALNTPCVGKFRLDGHDPRGPHLHGLFHDEIRSGLFDRREQKPEVRGHQEGPYLTEQTQFPSPLARLRDFSQPLAALPVKHQNMRAHTQAHHAEKVMRLIPRHRNRLPLPQRVIYIEPDFGCD